MLIIDSNIWAYYFDEDITEHKFVADKVEAKGLAADNLQTTFSSG